MEGFYRKLYQLVKKRGKVFNDGKFFKQNGCIYTEDKNIVRFRPFTRNLLLNPILHEKHHFLYRDYLAFNTNYWYGKPIKCYSLFGYKKEHNEGRYNRFLIENNNGCYYSNCRKEILFNDFHQESLTILKEAEIIKSNAFKYSCLTKVDFEGGSKLKTIESSAFENLKLEEITIPDPVEVIQNSEFYNCRNLQRVNIKQTSSLRKIGINAFRKSGIQFIRFPSNLKFIKKYSFYECFNLKSVEIFAKKMCFGYYSFAHSSIKKINFPPNSIFLVSSFYCCHNLKKLTFSEKPQNIIFGEESFAFSGLTEIRLHCSVTFKSLSFYSCQSLKKVFLSGNQIKVHSNAFLNSKIDELMIKENLALEQYNSYDFDAYNVSKLNIDKVYCVYAAFDKQNQTSYQTEIYSNHKCYVINDVLMYIDWISKNDSNEISIPSNVKSLNFQLMSHIKHINWGSNCILNDLGPPYHFSCHNLIEITIPKRVKTISSHLFESCHYLKTVEFEEDSELEEIGEFSFAKTRIEKIVCPKSVKIIKKAAFYDNQHLKEVRFHGEVIEEEAFCMTGIVKFVLSNNTKTIGNKAFNYCHSLKTFIINRDKSNLIEIGSYAFSESAIEQINIPAKTRIIKDNAFNGCKQLKQVFISLASELERIEDFAFAENLSLIQINIPSRIQHLSSKAFINTPQLRLIIEKSVNNNNSNGFNLMENGAVYKNDGTLIFVPRNLKQFNVKENCLIIHSGSFCGHKLEKVTFSDSTLLCIEECAFAHSNKLKEIKISNSVLSIGNEAFIDCKSLFSVEFESNCRVKEIPKFCFAFSGLKSIELPSSIEIINHSSFLFCKNIKKLNLHHTNVKFIGSYAFSETNIKNIKFPSSIKYIGSHVFDGNKSLNFINFCKVKQINETKSLSSYKLTNQITKLHKINSKLIKSKVFLLNEKYQNEEKSFENQITNKTEQELVKSHKLHLLESVFQTIPNENEKLIDEEITKKFNKHEKVNYDSLQPIDIYIVNYCHFKLPLKSI